MISINDQMTTASILDALMTPTKIGSNSPPTPMNYTGIEFGSLFCLNIFELFGHLLLDCPFSGINLFLIVQTAILHPNLKFILLCQSGCILFRGIVRIMLIFFRLYSGDFSTDGPLLLLILYGYPVFFRNVLSHVMILERIMATIFSDGYENWRKQYFSIFWFILVSLISLLCVGSMRSILVPPEFLNFLASINQIFSAIEIFIFSWIWKYNDKIYQRISHKIGNLSARYQLSENIRTAKQLFPTLILHFLNITLTTGAVLMGNDRWLGNRQFIYDFVLQAVFSAITLFNFLIELSMIICHPFLKREFLRIWTTKKFFNKSVDPNFDGEQNALTLTNMRGEKLVLNVDDEANRYFKELNAAWE